MYASSGTTAALVPIAACAGSPSHDAKPVRVDATPSAPLAPVPYVAARRLGLLRMSAFTSAPIVGIDKVDACIVFAKTRAGLGVNKDGAGLTLLDETGKPRAMLSMGKDGAGLALGDETGKKRAGLAVDKDGPRLALGDETGKARAGLTVSKDGPRLALSDENGKTLWSQP